MTTRAWSYDELGYVINPQTGMRFRYGDTFQSLHFNGWRNVKDGRRVPRFRLLDHNKGPHRSAKYVAKTLYNCARRRAIEKKLPFSLTRTWVDSNLARAVEAKSVVIPSRGDGSCHPRAPSIDRIIPSIGYTEDNCQIIPLMLNRAKGEWDEDSFLDVLGPEIDRLRAAKRMKIN